MKLEILPQTFCVCRMADYSLVDFDKPFCFSGCTDQEKSLVCPAEDVPANALDMDSGWRAFRISGLLDFSLIGILAGISRVLAEAKIGIFAISTYNTDYILVKSENFHPALAALAEARYEIEGIDPQ